LKIYIAKQFAFSEHWEPQRIRFDDLGKRFFSGKAMEMSEYFMYCGIFIVHYWDERFVKIAKEDFLRRPAN